MEYTKANFLPMHVQTECLRLPQILRTRIAGVLGAASPPCLFFAARSVPPDPPLRSQAPAGGGQTRFQTRHRWVSPSESKRATSVLPVRAQGPDWMGDLDGGEGPTKGLEKTAEVWAHKQQGAGGSARTE